MIFLLLHCTFREKLLNCSEFSSGSPSAAWKLMSLLSLHPFPGAARPLTCEFSVLPPSLVPLVCFIGRKCTGPFSVCARYFLELRVRKFSVLTYCSARNLTKSFFKVKLLEAGAKHLYIKGKCSLESKYCTWPFPLGECGTQQPCSDVWLTSCMFSKSLPGTNTIMQPGRLDWKAGKYFALLILLDGGENNLFGKCLFFYFCFCICEQALIMSFCFKIITDSQLK